MNLTQFSNALNGRRQDFHWIDIILILTIGAIIIGAGIGLREPWPADEPRFAAIARDMVRSGEWFFPRIGGVYYPDKPSVFFWLMASFYQLTGSLRVSFLLPSLLASLGVLTLVYDTGRRLWDRGTGLSAAILLLFTFQFTNSAKLAQIDMLLCFWITLSIYSLLRHLFFSPSWHWYYLRFVVAGMGVITKGVGFLPLLIFIPYLLAIVSGWDKTNRSWDWRRLISPLCFFLTISLWLVPMLVYVHNSADPALAAYRDNILFKQTGDRYLHARAHLKPVWYYFSNVIPFMWLPLSLLLPWIVPAWVEAVRAQDLSIFLLLMWVILVLLFFSLSSGKRGVYLLSVLPVMALLVAPYLRLNLQKAAVNKLLYFSLLALGNAGLAFSFFFTIVAPDKGAQLVTQYQITPWSPLIVLSLIALGSILVTHVQRVWIGWLGFLSCFWLIYSFWIYTAITDVRSGSTFIQSVEKQLEPSEELALVGWKEQFLLYLEPPVRHFGFRRQHQQAVKVLNERLAIPASLEAINWLGQQPGRVILIPEKRISNCFVANQAKFAGHANGQPWYLLTNEDVNPECIVKMADVEALLCDTKIGGLLN